MGRKTLTTNDKRSKESFFLQFFNSQKELEKLYQEAQEYDALPILKPKSKKEGVL